MQTIVRVEIKTTSLPFQLRASSKVGQWAGPSNQVYLHPNYDRETGQPTKQCNS